MIVTSRVSVDFPKFQWGINAGEERELPEDAEAQTQIQAHPDIVEVKLRKEPQTRVQR